MKSLKIKIPSPGEKNTGIIIPVPGHAYPDITVAGPELTRVPRTSDKPAKSLVQPGHIDPTPALNPDHRTITPLEELQNDPSFKERLLSRNLVPSDIPVICDDLEESGKAGASLLDFASKLGILSSELDAIRKTYPQIERSMQVSKGLRRKMLGELALAHAVRTPAAMKEVLNNDYFSKDFLSDEEESELEKLRQSLERRAEEILLANGITPCQHSQVVYLTGDVDIKTYETPADLRDYKQLGFHDAEALLRALNAADNTVQETDTRGAIEVPVLANRGPQEGEPGTQQQVPAPDIPGHPHQNQDQNPQFR